MRYAFLLLLALWMSPHAALHSAERKEHPKRLILAHYMPWFTAKPSSRVWGWHWTMNHFDPERRVNGRRAIASHFYPLVGPYDSSDSAVLEYHLLLMKLAGIDGVIVDWYGLENFNDYAILHRNTQRLVEQVRRLGMRLVICYEDQTIAKLIEAGRLAAANQVTHATAEINWLADNWFDLECYVHLEGKPVLLSFGYDGLNDDQWKQCLKQLKTPLAYFSEHNRRDGAIGAFDWPVPKKGAAATSTFLEASSDWPHWIPVAFPRFVDSYKAARVSDGYDRIEDRRGLTFRETLRRALSSKASLIQIATWNDWGEGTMIEPSEEFGYRDLEFIQSMRREHVDATFKPDGADLRLPLRLLNRRRDASGSAENGQLDQIASLLAQGKTIEARAKLKRKP